MIAPARLLRLWHAYIGLFIAPSVIFFALTGTIQLFGLHEAHGDYHPASILEKLGSIHKDQVLEKPHEQAPPSAETAPPAGLAEKRNAADDADPAPLKTYVLKWFFLAVALGLTASTAIGVWMGVTQLRRKSLGWALVAAGALIPIVILAV